jgi:hypothetical protein
MGLALVVKILRTGIRPLKHVLQSYRREYANTSSIFGIVRLGKDQKLMVEQLIW